MYKVYAITDVGKEREENQDGFIVDGLCCAAVTHRELYYETDAETVHVALFDGVGSSKRPTYAVEKAIEYVRNHITVKDEKELERLIIDLNAYVYDSVLMEGKADGATTMVGVVARDNTMFVYNIGDSPAFSVNNGYLEKQTVDDAGAFDFGEVPMDQEGVHYFKPPLFQTIGTNRLLDVVHINKIHGCKAVLLCSDGITDMLSLDEMEEIIESSNSLQDIARMFISEANKCGGYDNSTVIIMVEEEA